MLEKDCKKSPSKRFFIKIEKKIKMFKFFAIFLQSFERPSKMSNKLEILIPFLKLKKTFFFYTKLTL